MYRDDHSYQRMLVLLSLTKGQGKKTYGKGPLWKKGTAEVLGPDLDKLAMPPIPRMPGIATADNIALSKQGNRHITLHISSA
jgi:hypothetical protein